MSLGRCLDLIHSKISEDNAALFEYKMLAEDDVLETVNIMVDELFLGHGYVHDSW